MVLNPTNVAVNNWNALIGKDAVVWVAEEEVTRVGISA